MDLGDKNFEVIIVPVKDRREASTWYTVVEKDKWGVRYKGKYRGMVVADTCARLFCNHPLHGDICALCKVKWGKHKSAAWPGEFEAQLSHGGS